MAGAPRSLRILVQSRHPPCRGGAGTWGGLQLRVGVRRTSQRRHSSHSQLEIPATKEAVLSVRHLATIPPTGCGAHPPHVTRRLSVGRLPVARRDAKARPPRLLQKVAAATLEAYNRHEVHAMLAGEKSKRLELATFLTAHATRMEESGGSRGCVQLPQFDLFARDYLEFAAADLASDNVRNHINCVTNLKRAAECQLDSFLHAYNLFEIVKRRNLKFDKKLAFIRDIALFDSRSLARFNTIRNEIEHHYHKPRIADLEVYYDLVQALIVILEGASLFAGGHTDQDIYDSVQSIARTGVFTITYDRAAPSISVRWKLDDTNVTLTASPDEKEDFAYFFRVFLLLARRDAIGSDRYILERLKPT